jgi:hypothetical protein
MQRFTVSFVTEDGLFINNTVAYYDQLPTSLPGVTSKQSKAQEEVAKYTVGRVYPCYYNTTRAALGWPLPSTPTSPDVVMTLFNGLGFWTVRITFPAQVDRACQC